MGQSRILDDQQLEAELGPALGPVIRALGDYILQRMQRQGESDAWVSQRGSPIGPRRHCAVVRRLRAAADPRALIDGERFLLRRDALEEARQNLGTPAPAKLSEPDPDQAAVARVKARLGW